MTTLRARAVLRAMAIGSMLLAAPAWAGDFIDTRVTFTLGDDNFLNDAGEQVPDSPRLGIGDRRGYELAFDNLNRATTGRENELHLVLYKRVVGIIPRLITEAAAAIEVDLAELESSSAKLNKVFQDDSSYIRLAYALDPEVQGTRYVDLTLFPLSGDRFRVGYLYDLTWGGNNIFARHQGPTPAFKLGGQHGRFYWWSGMKMVRAQTAAEESKDDQGLTIQTREAEMLYGVLAGAGMQPIDGLSVDVSGAHIQAGENPIKDVAGEQVTASGFSARLAYGRGLRVGLSSDLRLVRNDPEFLAALSRRPHYSTDGRLSWSVAAEGTAVAQVLADSELYGGTTRQWATAGAIDIRLQYNYLRINLTALYRSVEFILRDTPSLTPFQALPTDTIVRPEYFAAASVDYHLPRLALTPGLQLGAVMPASVTTELTMTELGANAPPTLLGRRTVLIRDEGEKEILPENEQAVPYLQARFSTTWNASEMLTLIGYVYVVLDNNAVVLEVNPDFTKSRVFDQPIRVGAALMAQARF